MIGKIADGRTDLVFELLEESSSPHITDEKGTALIQWCAYYGDVSAIRFLLGRGEKLESLGENFDLNGAVFHGHWQLVQFLIEQGADVNHALNDTQESPLHSALCKANRPVFDYIVDILLAHGADPNAVTQPGKETGSFMRDARTSGETPLHRAAAFASEHAIDALLGAGANREAKDAHGDTPLSWASQHLRPASILRKLCYGEHQIHGDNHSSYDHGSGWGQLDPPLGKPHL